MAVSARRAVVTSFLVDFLDLSSSLIIAWISGSVVMLAQALEGGADLVSSGLLIFGLNRSLRHPDKNHPFGHGRELYFWTLISALFTFSISATLSFYIGWKRFLYPSHIHNLFLANLILLITVVTNGYALIISMQRLTGKKHESLGQAFFTSPLIETRTTFVLDLMGTLASLLGLAALLVYGFTGDIRFDGLGAMAIGATLALMAFFLILGVRDLLVGRSVSPEIEKKIIKAALSLKDVKSVTRLRTNHIGPDQILVELSISLDRDLITSEIEDIIIEIKQKIRQSVKEADFIQIELK